MRSLFVTTPLVALGPPTSVFAEIQTFTGTYTSILNDDDSKEDEATRDQYE
jgi:hypothetical protein